MRLSDDRNILDKKQSQLLLEVVKDRLTAKGLLERISILKVVPIAYTDIPQSIFEDDEKAILILRISPQHFLKPNIRFIIHHEIQHRIYELNPRFGYNENKKDRYNKNYGKYFSSALAHLWDIYINGRLDSEGLYQTDPKDEIPIEINGKRLPKTRYNERVGGIDILKKRGVRNPEQLYDRVWNASENELTYHQLAQLVLEYTSKLK